jgi:hypothetical protein
MFSEWMMDQQGRNDDVGRFARLCWEDYTAGCARYFAGAVEWRDHFQKKHPNKVDLIFPLLKTAFTEYVESLTPQRNSVEA